MLLFLLCVLRLKRAADVLANHKCAPIILEYKSRLKRTINITPLPTATHSDLESCVFLCCSIYWFIAQGQQSGSAAAFWFSKPILVQKLASKQTAFTWFLGSSWVSRWDTAPPLVASWSQLQLCCLDITATWPLTGEKYHRWVIQSLSQLPSVNKNP